MLAYTHFLHRFVFHLPLGPATPFHRDICRASSSQYGLHARVKEDEKKILCQETKTNMNIKGSRKE